MNPPFSPPDVILGALLLGAGYTDWKEGKIKNILTFPVMLAGILLSAFYAPHWYDGVSGLLAGMGVGIVLWQFGGAFHPGDVKLVMAAGALVGPEMICRGILWALVLNLPVGLAVLAYRGRLGNLWRFWVKRERDVQTKMIFGLVIGAGIILARVQPWPNLWGAP